MPNNIFNSLNQNNGMSNFVNFMNSMRGQDPNQIINSMLQSGKINQNQLNQIQNKAQQMQSAFAPFKQMFGFK